MLRAPKFLSVLNVYINVLNWPYTSQTAYSVNSQTKLVSTKPWARSKCQTLFIVYDSSIPWVIVKFIFYAISSLWLIIPKFSCTIIDLLNRVASFLMVPNSLPQLSTWVNIQLTSIEIIKNISTHAEVERNTIAQVDGHRQTSHTHAN